MFGFFRSAAKPAPVVVRRIGVDWGTETAVAVMLDAQGHPLDSRRLDLPREESEEYFLGLKDLLDGWPLADCHMVVSLTRDYHLATLDLNKPSAQSIGEKVTTHLSYDCDEASFAWWKIDARRVVAVAYPSALLQELAATFGALAAKSVHFEAVELAQARLLQTLQLPAGIVTVQHDLAQVTMVSLSDFETLVQSTAVLGVEQMLGIGMDQWKRRGGETPLKLLTNLSPDYLERISGLPCERLEEEALAFHLALSPEGPHRLALPAGWWQG